MKSFLSDRPRVSLPDSPREQPSALAPAPRGGPGCGASPAARAATVECVREGDRITRLVVTCVCGERVEIDCLYAAGS